LYKVEIYLGYIEVARLISVGLLR